MKTCTKCGTEKPLTEFHKSSRNKSGVIAQCRPCKNAVIADWDKRNPEKKRQQALKSYYVHYEKKKEKAREYKHNNRDEMLENLKAWRLANPDYVKESYWKNRDKFLQANAKRRAKKLKAYPAWANPTKIRAFYLEAARLSRETGVAHHVDHIVPLNSKHVCGLHVETNLQILTWYENVTKSNKFLPG